MNLEDIYLNLRKSSIYTDQFFSRELHVVELYEFQKFNDYFYAKGNFFNTGVNYRTKERFKHIHAVQKGNLVFFHYDYGNVDQSLPMYVCHTFLDVIPYFISVVVRRHKIFDYCLAQAKIAKEGST